MLGYFSKESRNARADAKALRRAKGQTNKNALTDADEQFFISFTRKNRDVYALFRGRRNLAQMGRRLPMPEREGITNFSAAMLGNKEKPGQISPYTGIWHPEAYRALFSGIQLRNLTDLKEKIYAGEVVSGFSFDITDHESKRMTKVFVEDEMPGPQAILLARQNGILILDEEFNPIRVATYTATSGDTMMVSYVDAPRKRRNRDY